MIFACSSGAAKRYIEDVARAIAMPPGMHLQFRYAAKYISPELRNTLERDPYALNGREVVLAYLDQSEARRKQHAAPKVVPCRAATIVSAEFIGTSYIFVYRLAGFAFPVTLKEAGSRDAAETVYQDYQESLHQLDCDLPLSWRRHGDRYRADGHWVCDVADAQLEVRSAPEDAGTWTMWESLVIELLTKSTDFADHGIGALFHIFYIGPESRHSPNAQMASPSQVCQFKHGQCELAVRGEHRIKLYVYAKDEEVENTAWIRFATLNEQISLQGSPLLPVDSRYDLKNLYFTVAGASRSRSETLLVEYIDAPEALVGHARFAIELTIGSNLKPLIAASAAHGFATTLASLLVLYRIDPNKLSVPLGMALIAATSSLAFIASYFERK